MICSNKRKVMWLIGSSLLLVAFILIWLSFNYSDEKMRKCTAITECSSYYSISFDGKSMLYFSDMASDSTLSNITTHADSLLSTKYYTTAVWVNKWALFSSCHGMIATTLPPHRLKTDISEQTVSKILKKQITKLNVMKDSLKHEANELRYYLKVHDMKDEGYDMIQKFASKINTELEDVDSILTLLNGISNIKGVALSHKEVFNIIYLDEKYKQNFAKCDIKAISPDRKLCVIQVSDKKTPQGVYGINMKPWKCSIPENINIVSNPGLRDNVSASVTAKSKIFKADYRNQHYKLPNIIVSDGSPVFDNSGALVGITYGGSIIGRRNIVKLLDKEK